MENIDFLTELAHAISNIIIFQLNEKLLSTWGKFFYVKITKAKLFS